MASDWAVKFLVAAPGQVGDVLAVLDEMAVRRSASGLGAVILKWAADVARQQGREALRLDCVASNSRLRAYYEAAGFAHRGDASVAGAPGQRLDEGPVTVVSRYEQRLSCRSGNRVRKVSLSVPEHAHACGVCPFCRPLP